MHKSETFIIWPTRVLTNTQRPLRNFPFWTFLICTSLHIRNYIFKYYYLLNTDLPELFFKSLQNLSQSPIYFLPLKVKDPSFKPKLQTTRLFLLTSLRAKKKAQQRLRRQPWLQIPSRAAEPNQWAGRHLENYTSSKFKAGTLHYSSTDRYNFTWTV